jgi:hypothetical protein
MEKTISDFARNLELGSKSLQMYSETHPRTQRAIQDAFQSMEAALENRSRFTINIQEGKLLFGGAFIEKGNLTIERLAKALSDLNVASLTFIRGIKSEDLLFFLHQLNLRPTRARELGGLEKILADGGIHNIIINKDESEVEDAGGIEELAESYSTQTPPPEPTPEVISLAEELLNKPLLSREDINKTPNALQELIQKDSLQEADQLSKKVFSYLGTGEPDQKIAALENLLSIIQVLLKNEKWKNVEFSLSFLISTCFRKETSVDILRAYIPYLLAMFAKNYEAKNWISCQDVLNTLRAQTQRHETVRYEFADQWLRFASVFIEHIRKGLPAVEVVLEGFHICGDKGVSYFIEMLANEDDQKVRSRLINLIVQFKNELVLRELERRMNDDRWFVVRNMVTIATKMNLSEMPDFLGGAALHTDSRVPKELIKLFYKGTPKPPAAMIMNLLEHPDRNVRLQAVHLITIQSLSEAIPHLLKLTASEGQSEGDLRAACWQALLKLRAAEAIRPAAAFLERKTSSKNEIAERNAAVRLLGILAPDEAKATLEKVAQADPHPETRAVAASYL